MFNVIFLIKISMYINEYPSFFDLNRRGLADTVLRNYPFGYFFLKWM